MKYENGKYYHVFNRGANKQNIFLNKENYRFCIQIVQKYSVQYNVSIVAYCLMPNHYHFLLLQNNGGSISKGIQSAFNSYAQAFNSVTNHSGTLFQGRAKGIEVNGDEYAVRLCRYIHCNPVTAKLVMKPEDWEYSDYSEWIGLRMRNEGNFILRDGYFGNATAYKNSIEEYGNDDEIKKYLFDE
jgi:putative transposase